MPKIFSLRHGDYGHVCWVVGCVPLASSSCTVLRGLNHHVSTVWRGRVVVKDGEVVEVEAPESYSEQVAREKAAEEERSRRPTPYL